MRAAACAASAPFSSYAEKQPKIPGMLHQNFAAAFYFTPLFSVFLNRTIAGPFPKTARGLKYVPLFPTLTSSLPAFQIESTLWQHAYFYLVSKSSLNLQYTPLVEELGQSSYFSSLNAEQSFSLTPSCLNKLLLH